MTNTKRDELEIKKHFEANMLDGEDVNNCGECAVGLKHVLEYIQENYILKSTRPSADLEPLDEEKVRDWFFTVFHDVKPEFANIDPAKEFCKHFARPSAGGLSLEKLTKILEDNNAGIYGTIGGWYGGKLSCSILAEAIVSAQSRERGEKSTPETVEHDVSVYGVAIQKDGKRIDPKDFYKASSSDSKIERTPTKPINNQEIDRRDGEAVECLKEIVGYIDKEGPCAKEWQAISDLCEKANQIISKHGGKA